MKKKIILTSIFFLLLNLLGCHHPHITTFVDIEALESDTLIRLHNWAILAPLLPDTNIAPLQRINQDLLTEYGESENNIASMNHFISIGKSVQQRDSSTTISQIEMPLHILDLKNFFAIDPPMTAYLATQIESSENSEVALNMSAYQSARFWLNGEEIYNIDWKRGRNFYREEFVPVTLKKGHNFLLVKLSVSDKIYRSPQWKLEVDISNIKTAKKLFYSAYSHHFLRNSLMNTKDSLRLYTGAFSKDTGKYQIFHKSSDKLISEGNIRAERKTGEMNILLSKQELEDGLYTCKLAFEDRLFSQVFFVGDIDLYIDSLKKNLVLFKAYLKNKSWM